MKLIFIRSDDPQDFVREAKRLLAAAEKKLGVESGRATEDTARLEQAVEATRNRAERLGKQATSVRRASDLL